jgi:hypothetical protein
VIKLSALWALLLLPLCSFSYTFGYTGNAALGGNTWGMTTPILGITTEAGMDISGVIYNYTAVKELQDDFTVTIQNEDTEGGYIFQETDDWSDGPGMRIQKVIALPYTPLERFGTGSIATTGTGTVEDASVLYMYRWDNCRDPQNDPNCPGYITPLPVIPKIEIYDALEDEYVQDATEKTDGVGTDKDEEIRETEEEDEEKDRLEIALAASENALTIAGGASQASLLKAMNIATNLSNYYVARVPGGVYSETISLQGGTIVDNRRALRSLGQDNLMNEMIGEQYK